MRLIVVCVVLALASTASWGQSRPTAGDLLVSCKKAVRILDGENGSAQDVVDATGCTSYLQGVRDALTMQYVGHGETPVMCLPAAITNNQLARIYIKWAEANPERHHEDQLNGVFAAFFPRYACPES